MSYINYYLQAREMSDRISRGELPQIQAESIKARAGAGILERKKEEPVEKETDYTEMVLKYMGAFREPLPEGVDTQAATPDRFNAGTPVEGDVGRAREAIAAIESRGSGDYSALGPVMKTGMYKGQRAIGRYQVMEGNIAPWTKAALGRSLTVDEFLKDKEAQDRVVEHRLSKSHKKHGTWEDAASVWFTGKPVKTAGNVSDGYTSAPEYIRKFKKFYGQTTKTSLVEPRGK